MLPIKNRLRTDKDYSIVYRYGTRRISHFLRLVVLRRQGENLPSRLGVVISKKVIKQAVGRNRVGRRIKAAFQDVLPRLRQPSDVVIILMSGKDILTSRQYAQILEKELYQLGCC